MAARPSGSCSGTFATPFEAVERIVSPAGKSRARRSGVTRTPLSARNGNGDQAGTIGGTSGGVDDAGAAGGAGGGGGGGAAPAVAAGGALQTPPPPIHQFGSSPPRVHVTNASLTAICCSVPVKRTPMPKQRQVQTAPRSLKTRIVSQNTNSARRWPRASSQERLNASTAPCPSSATACWTNVTPSRT